VVPFKAPVPSAAAGACGFLVSIAQPPNPQLVYPSGTGIEAAQVLNCGLAVLLFMGTLVAAVQLFCPAPGTAGSHIKPGAAATFGDRYQPSSESHALWNLDRYARVNGTCGCWSHDGEGRAVQGDGGIGGKPAPCDYESHQRRSLSQGEAGDHRSCRGRVAECVGVVVNRPPTAQTTIVSRTRAGLVP
jgi:hypothetical protein